MDLRGLHLELYLIRHATPVRKLNYWSSPTTPLSELGLNQAEKIAQFLKNQKFNSIITSPYKRTTQTANIITKYNKSTSLQVESWLSEIDIGEWTGRYKNDIKSQIPETLKLLLEEGYDERGPLVANLMMIDRNFAFPKGESLQEFWSRVIKGLSQTLEQFKGKLNQKLCFIGHGGSFTVIVLSLLDKSFSDQIFPLFMFAKANYTLIRMRKGKVQFQCMNPILQV
ncbi:MAG: histidine phosphatase family protein [Candidatus Thorarchaeota archaeon]